MNCSRSYFYIANAVNPFSNASIRFIGDGAARSSSKVAAYATVAVGYVKGNGYLLGLWGYFVPCHHPAWRMETSAVDWALSILLKGGSGPLPRTGFPAPNWLVELVEKSHHPLAIFSRLMIFPGILVFNIL